MPIIPVTRKFNIGKQYIEVSMTQFPVKQSSTKTIYKSQGSTYDEIIIDVNGPYHSFFKHIMYVAFSRVKTLQGFTLRFDEKSIKTDAWVLAKNTDGINVRNIQMDQQIPPRQYGYLNIHYIHNP